MPTLGTNLRVVHIFAGIATTRPLLGPDTPPRHNQRSRSPVAAPRFDGYEYTAQRAI